MKNQTDSAMYNDNNIGSELEMEITRFLDMEAGQSFESNDYKIAELRDGKLALALKENEQSWKNE